MIVISLVVVASVVVVVIVIVIVIVEVVVVVVVVIEVCQNSVAVHRRRLAQPQAAVLAPRRASTLSGCWRRTWWRRPTAGTLELPWDALP